LIVGDNYCTMSVNLSNVWLRSNDADTQVLDIDSPNLMPK